MNFFSRLGRGIVIMIPTAVVAFILIYTAWNRTCDTTSCKTINLLVMLTGLVLALWSLIVLAGRLLTSKMDPNMSTGRSMLVNLTEILPLVLFYAAFAGVMAYLCFTMFREYLANTEKGINKLLFVSGLFLPIYELTRIMERKSSVESTSFSTQVKMHLQSIITFAGWFYLMMYILKNRSSLPDFAKKPGWENISLLVAMGLASIILYKCYDYIEKNLREQGTISWNSKYFGKN